MGCYSAKPDLPQPLGTLQPLGTIVGFKSTLGAGVCSSSRTGIVEATKTVAGLVPSVQLAALTFNVRAALQWRRSDAAEGHE